MCMLMYRDLDVYAYVDVDVFAVVAVGVDIQHMHTGALICM